MELTVISISMFQETNSLSKVTIDRLDSALTLTIVNCYLHVHNFIWEIQYFGNLRLNHEVNCWLKTTKASLIFQLTFELKVLMSQTFNTLFLNVFHL